MRLSNRVTAPDGTCWLVRRRWLDGSWPDLDESFQRNQDRIVGAGSYVQFGSGGEGEGILDVIAAVVVGALVVFVVLPLLGVALELVALAFVVFSGVLGRIFLGRPWIVEAVPEDGDGEPVLIPVKGWRRAGDAVRELEREIAVNGPLDPAVLDGRTF